MYTFICIVKKFKRYDVTKFPNEKRFIFKNYKLSYRTQGSVKMNKFQEGLQQQRKVAEQLRLEAAIPRVRVSECVRDIKKYCEQNAEDDVLIRGFPRPGDNPFKEKGGCAIL